MHTTATTNLLLRASIELPEGLSLATEQFHQGWNFSRSVNANHLEKRLKSRGWNTVKIEADGRTLRSGVGDTAQQAIASALKLALRQISEHFNAVEIEQIQLTQYPWLFLARVKINPFRIQQSTMSPWPDHMEPPPPKPRRASSSLNPSLPHLHSCSITPRLKEILLVSRSEHKEIE
ncbi:MAG: hypothetical protein ACP5E2_13970 [Terracidiphilus sp.]